MKTCSKCKRKKPRTGFYKDQNKIDGLRYQCKTCFNSYRKKYLKENTEKVKVKAASYRSYHKAEMKAYKKNYRASPQGKKVREDYLSKLSLSNRKISKRTLSSWSLKVRQRDDYICMHCYHEAVPGDGSIHAHHILSKARFPQYALDVSNGISLCKSCHLFQHQHFTDC